MNRIHGTDGGKQPAGALAGQVALVRARYPGLTADQVIRRIEATADRIGNVSPDPRYGWGLIDLGVSVTRVIPDEGRVAAPPPPVRGPGPAPGPRAVAIVIIAAVFLAAVVLLMLRLRWIIRPSTVPPRPANAGDESASGGAAVKTIEPQAPPSIPDSLRPTTPAPTGSDDAKSARGIPAPGADQRTPVGSVGSTATPESSNGGRGSSEHA